MLIKLKRKRNEEQDVDDEHKDNRLQAKEE